jgi:hypothetical protein|tara:strand:+ start:1799 stop:2332 length:534 start_codon:yes stop_codon:yes gene_type:complete
MKIYKINKLLNLLIISTLLFTLSCGFKNKNTDKNRPLSAKEKREQNIKEGKGASLGSVFGKVTGNTNFEFSSSNPMWRASLETLDFLPLITVDYSGGMIITDWYSEESSNESIKITVRFLSNEIRSDSIKIIVHKKICSTNIKCNTSLSTSDLIKNELRSTILRKASLIEKNDKVKK